MNFEPQCKKPADLHREWARVLDMCEGTVVKPEHGWKYQGSRIYEPLNFSIITYDDIKWVEFSLGIIEGKHVFRGAVYYSPAGERLIARGIEPLPMAYWNKCSFNPPKKEPFHTTGEFTPPPYAKAKEWLVGGVGGGGEGRSFTYTMSASGSSGGSCSGTHGANNFEMIKESVIPEGFTKWEGGEGTRHPLDIVRVYFRCGKISEMTRTAEKWNWEHAYGDFDIIAYKIVNRSGTRLAESSIEAVGDLKRVFRKVLDKLGELK